MRGGYNSIHPKEEEHATKQQKKKGESERPNSRNENRQQRSGRRKEKRPQVQQQAFFGRETIYFEVSSQTKKEDLPTKQWKEKAERPKSRKPSLERERKKDDMFQPNPGKKKNQLPTKL